MTQNSHAPTPWHGEIEETTRGTLLYLVKDQSGALVAELNELNRHAHANLKLISKAPDLLEELKNALAVIEIESGHLTAFISRARILIKQSEDSFI